MSNSRMLHSMIRIGDLDRSIKFYTELLGMKVIRKSENAEYKYSLVFVGYGEGKGSELELTYNWGTQEYDLGNAFGHIAIGVDDIYQTCNDLKAAGANVTREAGPVKGGTTIIAFVKDPDGYMIELIQNDQADQGLQG